MSSFTPTNRSNPCPVCGDVKGKCRTTDQDLVLCMGWADADSNHPDWQYVKSSRDGLWGIHAPRKSEYDPVTARSQQAALDKRREQQRRERVAQHTGGLSIEQRSDAFRQLLTGLTLDHDHHQSLKQRGLSDVEIQAGLFRSVVSGQRVNTHHQLPGVKHHRLWFGKKGDRGFICPAFNHQGQIIGAQVRRDNPQDDGRYRWLKGSNTSHLPNGELPITTIIPDAAKGITIVEGILKPYISAHRHGYAAIGAAGGLFQSSPEQLKTELAILSQHLGTNEVLFPVDAESRANEQVWRRDSSTVRLIESWGYKVKVGDWGQRDDKAAPDFDELPTLDRVRWIEFDHPPEKANGVAPSPQRNDKPKDPTELIEWLASLKGSIPNWMEGLGHLVGTAHAWAKELGLEHVRVDRALKQFKTQYRQQLNTKLTAEQGMSLTHAPVGMFGPVELPSENERRLILLNGQKGTGKTSGAISSFIRGAKAFGLSTLTIVPTRFLSRDTANRLGLTCHLDEERAARSKHVVTCPESVQKFSDRQWDIVIVDESNEVIPRSWLGSLGSSPKAAREAFTQAIAAAQTVVLSQDGLYTPVVHSIQRLGGFTEAQTQTIERRRPAQPMTINLYISGESDETWDGAEPENSGSADRAFYGWLAGLSAAIGEGQRIALPSGSRVKARQLYRLLRKEHPGKKICIVDGRDSFASTRNAIAQNFDGWLSQNEPDVVIWTPVFNSGVSIESDYFDAQYEYVSPFETSTSASQRGERVRAVLGGGSITERHVFIQRRGLPTDVPEEVLRTDYWQTILTDAAQHRLKDALKALPKLGLRDLEKALKDAAVAPVEDYPELAQVLAIQAREIHLKVECLKTEWEGNGWTITPGRSADKKTAQVWAQKVGWVSEGIIDTRSRTYAKAPSHFTENNSAKLNKALEGSIAAWEGGQEPEGPIDAAHQHRWNIERLVGNQPWLSDPDWWAAFDVADPHAIAALRLRALVTMPEQDFEALQWWGTLATIGKASEDAPALPNLPVSYRELGKAALLRQAPGLVEAITGELAQWDKSHETITRAKDWCIANSRKLAALSRIEQRWHGYKFTEKTPAVKCFHKLLNMVGHETKSGKRSAQGGVYRLKAAADVQAAIDDINWDAPGSDLKAKRLVRDLHRHEQDQTTLEAIATHIRRQGAAALSDWEKYQAELTAQNQAIEGNAELQKSKPETTSEVLHTPPEPSQLTISEPPPPPPQTEYQPGDRVWAWIDGEWQQALIRAKGLCGWLLEGRCAAFLPEMLSPLYL